MPVGEQRCSVPVFPELTYTAPRPYKREAAPAVRNRLPSINGGNLIEPDAMLNWDLDTVRDFLGVRAVFEDNSSYTFSFLMFGRESHLQVFPEWNEVVLTIGNLEQERAVWRLSCSEISHDDEPPEEGGDCLVFKPILDGNTSMSMTHWIVLGRNASGFQIMTVFRSEIC